MCHRWARMLPGVIVVSALILVTSVHADPARFRTDADGPVLANEDAKLLAGPR